MHLPPFNISIIDPDEYIPRKGLLPVTDHAIFELNTRRFHPEGFFSEAIFGQIGSRDRLVKKGYINLRTEIINPHLFRQLVTLKGYYQDILASKVYAYYDPELKDLVKTTRDDPKGRTGFAFFLESLPLLEFQQTSSTKRKDKIALLLKYEDRILIDKLVVIPAGLRDVKVDAGRVAPEEINKLYFALLSLTQALPDGLSKDPIYDAIRYKIQMQVQEIYVYIANLIDGKGGFASAKYAARAVAYGNRNVITAAPLTRVMSPQAPNMFHVDEVQVPLFQALKGSVPLLVHTLKTVFFDQVFANQTNTISLINAETFQLEYAEVPTSTIQKFTTSDGINDLINNFRNVEIQKDPVYVESEDKKKYCVYLIYDNNDEIFTFRNIEDFTHSRTDFSKFDISRAPNLKVVDTLGLHNPVVIGSTALAVYGMGITPQDVDLELTVNEFKQQVATGTWKQEDNGSYSKVVDDIKVNIYNTGTDAVDQSVTEVDNYTFLQPVALYNKYYATHSRAQDTRKIEYLKHEWLYDPQRLRPMTWVELFYMAAYKSLRDKYCTATRYPVLLIENIQAYHIHLMSTTPSRIVKLRTFTGVDNGGTLLPEYPDLKQVVKTSMSMSPSTLDKYGGKMIAAFKSLRKAGNPTE